MSLFCALVISLALMTPMASAKESISSNAFANTLNSAMLNCGVLSTEDMGGYINFQGNCPTGVLYADMVSFENATDPCLVIVYTNGNTNSVNIDIYRYDKKTNTAKSITTISKSINIPASRIAELALAEGGDYRYVVYTEYEDGLPAVEEYYTVIKGDAFKRVATPENKTLFGVLSFSSSYLHPEVDVSAYNQPLTVFFSALKDRAAGNVEYTDIVDDITTAERERLSRVLKKTAEFTLPFDIGDYSAMADYSLEVNRHEGEGVFNAITNIYDLGDGIYYIRYSTDRCFYNGTILRRTDRVTDNYQILAVRNDFIPFSDAELVSLKKAYLKNRLVLEKSSGGMELKTEPLIKVNKLDVEKPLEVPQKISPSLRKPLALIGGGIILGLFIVLWIYFTSDDNKK